MRAVSAWMPILLMLLAGCTGADSGDDDHDGDDAMAPSDFVTPPMDDEGRYIIEVGAGGQLAFSPEKAKVPAEATVLFRNVSETPHDVQALDGTFSSGNIGGMTPEEPEFEYTFTSTETGEILYFCQLHGRNTMNALIFVG